MIIKGRYRVVGAKVMPVIFRPTVLRACHSQAPVLPFYSSPLNVSFGVTHNVMQGLHQNRILPNKFGPILPEYGLNQTDSVDSELIRP